MPKRVFISQTTKGKTAYETKDERDRVTAMLVSRFGDVEILEPDFQDFNTGAKPLFCLGKFFEVLADADLAVFVNGWKKSRACLMEHEACIVYGIEILEEEV